MMKRVRSTKKDETLPLVLVTVGAIVGVVCLVLILWDILAPLKWVAVPLQRDEFQVASKNGGGQQSPLEGA